MKTILRTLVGTLASSVLISLPLAPVLFAPSAVAQSGAANGPMLQQKLASIKASAAENQRKLHQYTWTQTTQVTLNGEARPPQEFMCSYGPNGKVQKVPMGNTPDANSGGGRFRQRVVAKKKAEMKDYMEQVGRVLELYMPPNPQKMQQAFEQRKVSLKRSNGSTELDFRDYALPGDLMTIGFSRAEKRISSLNVHSYLDSPSAPVSLQVSFATLPDGTNYPQRTTIDAPAKNISIVNTNSNYRKAVQ